MKGRKVSFGLIGALKSASKRGAEGIIRTRVIVLNDNSVFFIENVYNLFFGIARNI